MEPLLRIEGTAIPFDRPNVDTDQIIPARFIMKPRRFDYATVLFHDLRFGPEAERDFPLDRPAHRGASILVTAENFACGSAREQAVWALQDFGIRALIGPSFGGIFYANCIKNGLLPAIVDAPLANLLCEAVRREPALPIEVSLEEQVIRAPGHVIAFRIAEGPKAQLLGGKDDIARTLEHAAAIEAFERRLATSAQWTRPSFDEAIGTKRSIPLHPAKHGH